MMWKGANIEVIDLGANVTTTRFVESVIYLVTFRKYVALIEKLNAPIFPPNCRT